MQPEESQRIALDTLIRESQELRKFVQDGFATGERFFAIGVTVVVGALTLALVNDHQVVFVVLPFPLLLLFASALQLFTEALNRAGYRCYLETVVNKELGRAVLIEESYVAASRQGRVSLPIMQLLFALAMVASGVKSVQTAFSDLSTPMAWVIVLALVAGASMVLAAFREMSTAFKRGYDAAWSSQEFDGDSNIANHPMLDPARNFNDFRMAWRRQAERRRGRKTLE
jgi:hypothetical protein